MSERIPGRDREGVRPGGGGADAHVEAVGRGVAVAVGDIASRNIEKLRECERHARLDLDCSRRRYTKCNVL